MSNSRLFPEVPMSTIIKSTWSLVIICLSIWLFGFSGETIRDDLMAYSGFITIILGLFYSVFVVDRSFSAVIENWRTSGIMDIPIRDMRFVLARLRHNEVTVTTLVALSALAVTAIGFAFLDKRGFEFVVASLICAALVGLRLGRLVALGMIGRVLKKRKKHIRYRVFVGLSDGTGGWARIGNFYLLRASIIVIPVVWLSTWLVLIETDSIFECEYGSWVMHFYALLSLLVLMFSAAFIWPLLVFKSLMIRWRRKHIDPEICAVRQELIVLTDSKVHSNSHQARSSALVIRLNELERIPEWPLSRKVMVTFLTTIVAPLLTMTINHFLLAN